VGVAGFETTQWSVVLAAGADSSPQAASALERLCQIYRYPLYAFIRRQGRNPHDAEDLTQAFFAHFLQGKCFRFATPERGRFRSFLLTSLKNFLTNEWERGRARKRGGGSTLVSLDDPGAEERYLFEPATDLSPDKLFDRRWAIAVMDQALHILKGEHAESGKQQHFELLAPFLSGDAGDGEYERVAAKLGSNANNVAVSVHRLRQRYREVIRERVAETVTTVVELDEEMQHLLAALAL
jgi:RNA polymerase sigma-70 factor (ECF subfamily)